MELFDILFQIVAFPIQLISFIITGTLNVLVFDLLQLGPFLPITF